MKRALLLAGVAAAVALASSSAGARAASGACPTSNPPNELLLAGGSGRRRSWAQFAQNLQVALANTNGCPLTGNPPASPSTSTPREAERAGVFAPADRAKRTSGPIPRESRSRLRSRRTSTLGTYTVDAHSDTARSSSHSRTPPAGSLIDRRIGQHQPRSERQQQLPAAAAGTRVTDANGNPVQGANVTFSILPGPPARARPSSAVNPARPPTRTASPPHRH